MGFMKNFARAVLTTLLFLIFQLNFQLLMALLLHQNNLGSDTQIKIFSLLSSIVVSVSYWILIVEWRKWIISNGGKILLMVTMFLTIALSYVVLVAEPIIF